MDANIRAALRYREAARAKQEAGKSEYEIRYGVKRPKPVDSKVAEARIAAWLGKDA